MSDFLRNIARRAAGPPAESPVAPNLPPAIALERPTLANPIGEAPDAGSAAPARGSVSAATLAPALSIQRSVAAMPAPPAATVAPVPSIQGNVAAPLAPPAATVASVPSIQRRVATPPAPAPPPVNAPPSAPGPIATTPIRVQAPAESAAAPATTVFSPTRFDDPRPFPAPANVTEEKTIERARFAERPLQTLPPHWTGMVVEPPAARAPLSAPHDHGRESAEVPPEPPGHAAEEEIVHYLSEWTYARESAVPPLALDPAKREMPPKAVEQQPEVASTAPPSEVELRAPALVTSVPSREKRSVNVRIGTLELKLPPAPAPVATAQEAGSGFDGFDDVRNYRF